MTDKSVYTRLLNQLVNKPLLSQHIGITNIPCPSVVSTVHYTLYIVHYTLYSVHYTLYSVQCTSYVSTDYCQLQCNLTCFHNNPQLSCNQG